jgi:hypothetical protein
MTRKLIALFALAAIGCAGLALPPTASAASSGEKPLPRIVEKSGRHALYVDEAPYFVLGAQVNNSSGWPSMLPKVWPAVEYLKANTVEIPVYWEQLEPKEGQFDFSVVDTLLKEARAHDTRLVLLWFATWKNGAPHYVPEWVKSAPERFPRVLDENGKPVDSLSPFGTATLAADTKAFTALMAHLKAADPQRTVLMIQVENEPGVYGTLRDHSPEAVKLFEGPAPYDVRVAMGVSVNTPTGDRPLTWREAFGTNAEVYFHAWAVAKFIGQVAAAGKAVYPLPMFSNAALRDPFKGAPGSYESGGPTDNVIPIYKVAAPALDFVGPDNYFRDGRRYLRVLQLYRRADNALYLPETGGSPRLLFFALGQQAIGFAPFGIDFTRVKSIPDLARPKDELLPPWALTGTKEFAAPFVPTYALLAPMARDLARWSFEGRLQATAEEPGETTQSLSFGAWEAQVSYGVWARRGVPAGNPQPMGAAFVAQIAENQFMVSGFYCRVNFRLTAFDRPTQWLKVEEGVYENGQFKVLRLLNGDQTDGGLDFSSEPLLLRVSVGSY